MDENIIRRLEISPDRLEALNAILLNPDMRVIDDFLAVVARYGTPEEINRKAAAGDADILQRAAAAGAELTA